MKRSSEVLDTPCFRALIILLLLTTMPFGLVSAQSILEPASPDVVAYVHLSDPQALASQLPKLAAPFRLNLQPAGLKALLGRPLNDAKLALATPGKPMSFVWLKQAGATPAMIAILPEVADVYYIEGLAREKGWKALTVEGLSIMGPGDAVSAAANRITELKQIHESEYPSAVCCFFSGSVWQDKSDQAIQLLARQPLAQIAASAISGSVPAVTAPAVPLPIRWETIRQVARDVQSAQLLIDLDGEAARLVVNLTATPGTPLAAFCMQPAPEPNGLSRYLPSEGWLHAAWNFKAGSLVKVAKDEGSRAAASLRISSGETKRLLIALESSLASGGPAAFSAKGEPGQTRSFLAITTPDNAEVALDEIERFLEYSSLQFLNNPPSGAPMPAPQALAAPAPKPPEASPEPLRQVEKQTDKNPQEGFAVYQFHARSGAALSPPLLSVCFPGPNMIAATDRSDLNSALNRAIRMEPLREPLFSQNSFLQGANAYLDFRMGTGGAESAKQVDWVQAMLRLRETRAQLALQIPYSALAQLIAQSGPNQ